MTANLAHILTDSVDRYADRPAVKLGEASMTYAQLDGAVARCAGMLRRLGVQAGDRVGIMLPNVPYFPIVYYAILRVGGIVVPMNVLLKGRETSFYLTDSGAKAIFAWMGFADTAKVGAEAAGAELVVVTPGEFEKALAAEEPVTETVDRDGSDTEFPAMAGVSGDREDDDEIDVGVASVAPVISQAENGA